MADFGITEIAAIAGILGSGASAYSALTSGSKAAPPPPALEKPTTMPTPDDDAARAAKRRAAAGLAQKRGRQSTILSDPVSAGGDLLGA